MPQAQGYLPDGTPIPAAQLEAALQAGTARFRKGDKVKVVNDYGLEKEVDGTDVAGHLATGQWQIEGVEKVRRREQAQKYGTHTQALKAGATGVVSGLTLGLSDLAASAADPEYAKAVQAWREEHGALRPAAEIAGAIVPVVATAGAAAPGVAAAQAGARLGARGLAAGALRATPAALAVRAGEAAASRAGLGRLGSLAVEGTVEGAIAGAGMGMADQAIKDPDLSAEKLAAAGFVGGLTGAATGGLLGTALGAASKGLGKLSRQADTADGIVDTALDPSSGPALARTAQEMRAGSDELAQQVVSDAVQNTRANLVARAAASVDQTIDPKALRAVAADPAMNVPGRLTARADEVVSSLERAPAAPKPADSWLRELGEAEGMKHYGKFKRDRTKVGQAADEWGNRAVRKANAAGLLNVDLKTAFQRAQEFRNNAGSRLGEIAREVDRAGGRINTGRLSARIDKIANELDSPRNLKSTRDVGRAIRRQFEGTLDQDSSMSHALRLRQDLDKSKAKWEANRETETIDAYRRVREAFEDEIDRTVGQVSPELQTQRRQASQDYFDWVRMEQAIGNQLDDAPSGFLSGGVSDALAGGAGLAIGVGMGNPVAGLLSGIAISSANRWIKNKAPNLVARVAHALSQSDSALKHIAQAHAGTKAISRIRLPKLPSAKSVIIPSTLGVSKLKQRYEEKSKDVRGFMDDPQATIAKLEKVSAPAAETAPGLAQAMISQNIRANQYLAENLPTPSSRASATLTPLAETELISPSEMREFLNRVFAVENPIEALLRIADEGKLDLEIRDTVKAVYPQIYEQTRTKIALELSTRKEPLPYNRRVLLGVTFELPTDPSLKPEFIMRLQGMQGEEQAPAQEQEQEQEAGQPQAQGANINAKFGEQLATKSQSLGT